MPQTITDGFLYIVRSTRSVFFDYDNQRIRLNPPANWNETNTQDPAYIANKPTTISGYGITDAYTKTEMNTSLNNKVDKVSGKVLSTNDYTTAEKNKLAGIAAGAEVNVNADWTAASGDAQILHKPTTLEGYGVEDEVESKVQGYSEYGVDTAEGNPVNLVTKAAQKAKHTVIDFEPIQDLHGYDRPWPGGGGKNLLPQGNGSTYGEGITFTVSSEGIVTAKGTATDTSFWGIQFTLPAGTYIMNGCPSGGGTSSYRIDIRSSLGGTSISGINQDTGSGSTFTLTESLTAWLNVRIANGYACPSSGLVFYPMIRKSTESDSTFAPYSNICPISGVDKVEMNITRKNLLTELTQGSVVAETGAIVIQNNRVCTKNKILLKKGTYTISSSASNIQVVGYVYINNVFVEEYSFRNNWSIVPKTFSVPVDFSLMLTFCYVSGANIAPSDVTNAQLELGSIATSYTPYEPYTPSSLSLDLPKDIYSGTLDLESGELVVDKGILDMGDYLSVSYNTTYNVFMVRYTDLDNYAQPLPATLQCGIPVLSDTYKTGYTGNTLNSLSDIKEGEIHFCLRRASTVNKYITIKDSRYDDADVFKTTLAGKQLVYPLNDPIIYHLTPTQLELFRGTNNISTNAKKLTVTYNKGELALIEDIYHEVCTFEQKSEASNPITIETDSAQYSKATHLTLEPVQDLHGYDKPWPGGGGKNLLPMTVEGMKAENSGSGYTWNGNSAVNNGITYKILTDESNNVIGILLTGTASSTSSFFINTSFSLEGTYITNGCPSNGSSSSYYLNTRVNGGWSASNQDIGNGSNNLSGTLTGAAITIMQNYSCPTAGLLFKPMIRLATESDATFEPYSNICPISGLNKVKIEKYGKNLFENTQMKSYTNNTVTYTKNDDGTVVANGTSSPSYAQYPIDIDTTKIYGNVYFVGVYDSQNSDVDAYIWDTTTNARCKKWNGIDASESSTDGTLVEVNIPKGHTVSMRLRVFTNKTVSNYTFYPMIVSSNETDATFEPYSLSELSLDLPETVYGGTLDLESGELVCDYGIVDLGTLTWTYRYEIAAGIFSTTSISNYKLASNLKAFCSNYDYKNTVKNINKVTQDKSFYFYYLTGSSTISFYIKDSAYTTAADFKTAMSGVQLCYELAIPRTYHLTPAQLALLKGTNNISTNAKTVQVTYRNGVLATLEDVVDSTEVAKQSVLGEASEATDNKIAESLVPILGNFASAESSPAIANHAVGEYLIYGDKLYKVISAIAAGETLTVGTNISATTVAAEFGSVNIIVNKLMPSATAGAHNGIYRGKDISSYFSDGSLWSRINGTNGYSLFEDLYVGDYIVINGRSYTIVDFDYYIRCGDTDFNTHHLVMMPTGVMSIPAGTVLYNPDTSATQETLTFINTANAGVTVSSQETATAFKWNATMADPNTHNTNGGYKYSRMRTVIMRAADTIVVGDFGASHVKAINPIYPNPSDANASGLASNWTWFNNSDWTNPLRKSICDLPNETQVYGQQVWGRGNAYTNMGYEVGVDKFQFAIFALHRNFANIRSYWWLRSVFSASLAAHVNYNGHAHYYGSSTAFAVRPRFLIS